ncbi:dTMP kinase [Patescibacteria group bacterium]|nr:dTMP kinase [Patescibacteria group bacterium]
MKKRRKKSQFIVFEGIDGAGKTTQGSLLFNYFQREQKKSHFDYSGVHLTQEPTTSLIGGLIRSQLTHDWKSSPECLQLLFAADRMYHLKKEILPSLQQGMIVIGDRYLHSSIAYGTADGCEEQWLFQINKNILQPDIIFLLDVSPRVCIQRILAERYGIALFEKEKVLKRVRANYLMLASKDPNFHIINGDQAKEKVQRDIQKILSSHIS